MNEPAPDPPPDHLVSGFHSRGKLPHVKREGAAYFVTFRLADSIPAERIAQLKLERAAILAKAVAGKRPLTWHEQQQLFAWYSERVERLLDAGHGGCWLNHQEIARLVAGAVKFFGGQRYDLHAWVVMPNHVHVVVWPYPSHTLSEILQSWKSFTSHQAGKLLQRPGLKLWQSESYDHWIRDDDEQARLSAYVEDNPVTAHLCERPEAWLWSSAYDRMVAAGVAPASAGARPAAQLRPPAP